MKRSSQKNERGSPERLADALIARIFRGEFPPGSHLPAERQLAADLGVDRTTLRMALKQLQRMNLLVARHGSGIEVQDYRAHGGLDLLAALFSIDDLPLEGSFIAEALDFWLEIFSMMAAKAVVRMSLDDLRSLERRLDDAVAAGDDLEARVAALLDLTDAVAHLSGSVLFRMANNSTRTLRARIMRILPATVDPSGLLTQLRMGLRAAALNRPGEEEVRKLLLEILRALTGNLREQLLFGAPPVARRLQSPRKERKR